MEIKVSFPGGKKVNAEIGGRIVATDQPVEAGGDSSAPSPFEYFLASLATCAGIYVLSFCQQREIATEGLGMTQRAEYKVDESGNRRLATIEIDITLPPAFPEKYKKAIERSAALCSVKKVLLDPPEFVIKAQ
jgi:ribosomal protein S12 methylthiotransferase accessory factor